MPLGCSTQIPEERSKHSEEHNDVKRLRNTRPPDIRGMSCIRQMTYEYPTDGAIFGTCTYTPIPTQILDFYRVTF